MQIINKIDKLISQLNNLKPELSDNLSSNEKKFTKLLKSNIEANYIVTDEKIETNLTANTKLENTIPNWVDPEYGYDPQNPRKPNMREMMEALSGKFIEDLYKEPTAMWQKIRGQASEILYGVIGSNEDTRDWHYIMASENILKAAQDQTETMYKPEIDIKDNVNKDGILTEQLAVIKDSKGNTLRSLSNDITAAEGALLNFGITRESIPTNLEEKIDPAKFDGNLLTFLKNFDKKPTSIEQIVVQSASEVITNKLSQEIPLDELAKL